MKLTDEQLAESLLLVTGLLRVPDRTDVKAAKALYLQLRAELFEMLDRKTQTPIRANDLGFTYFKRLAATPQYQQHIEYIDKALGLAVAGIYQTKHEAARKLLIARYPALTIDDPVFGVREMKPDRFRLSQWRKEAAFVENQRLSKDLSAAALMPETIAVFRASFPATYAYLVGELQKELVTRKVDKWLPALWQRTTIKLFLGNPIDPGAKPLPKPQPKGGDGKLDSTVLQTLSQQHPK